MNLIGSIGHHGIMDNTTVLLQRNQTYWGVGLSVLAAVSSVAGLAGATFFGYNGDLLPQLFLWAASLCLVLIVIKRPTSAFLNAITFFLILGFPIKFTFHQVFGTDYIEPTGDFFGSSEQWNAALSAAASGIFGVALAGTVWLFFTKRDVAPYPLLARTRFYITVEKPLALICIALSVALFAANWKYAFVKIGVEPLITLPGPLHAVVSFLIQWGIALWAGCMLYWAWSAGRLPMWGALLIGLIEGCVAGISNLSRARYIFHSLSFFFGWMKVSGDPEARMSWPRILVLLFVAAFLAVVSLLAVSVDRAVSYQSKHIEVAVDDAIPMEVQGGGKSGESGDKKSAEYGIFVSQISKLFVDRWIGMEGVMSVAAYDLKGPDLLWNGITEDPRVRGAGLYERISSSAYKNQEGLTFTTTAGGIAILFYSGSYLTVAMGMFLLTIAGLLAERFAIRWTASTFASGVVAVAIANAICQVNQPYLSAVLAIELLATCFVVWLFRSLIERFAR